MNEKSDLSPLILTIDYGTQSVRVSAFERDGKMLVQEKKTYEPAYFSTSPGYAERNPDDYYDDFCVASRRLIENNPELIRRVKGVVISCFRDTAVCLDKDLKVIRPTILWADQRYAKCEDKLPLLSRIAFNLVGMGEVIRMNRRRTAMNWIKENEPENFKRIDKYVAISTYLTYRLSGELRDCPSNYTGHYPIDFKKGEFYKSPETHLQGSIFSIGKNQLPTLSPGLSKLGEVTEQGSKDSLIPKGVAIYAAGSDKACETLGCGVISEDIGAISLGTACSIETTMRRYVGPTALLPAYPFVLPGYHNMDFQIYRGFWMVNWFLKEFGSQKIEDLISEEEGDLEDFDRRIRDIPSGADGLLLQPYWGSQLDRPRVKGSVVGFSASTTKYHFYRALLEGIGYELRQAKEQFEKRLKHPIKEFRIAGGGAKSDNACQIVADILKTPVRRVQTIETSSLGASIAGFLAIGEFATPEEAIRNMVHEEKAFIPNKENGKVYDELYENGYKKLYPSLRKVYEYLFDYSQK